MNTEYIKNSRVLDLLVALIALLLPQSVLSADAEIGNKKSKEVYFQVLAGNTKNETRNADLYDINTKDTALGIDGGIEVNRNFFIDFRFVALGNYETPDNTYEESFSAITASLVGKLPVGNSGLSVYGSVGYGFLTWEYTLNTGFVSAKVKDTGDTITGGVGLQYIIPGAEAFAVSLGYNQYYFRTGSVTGVGEEHSNTIELIGLGLQYRIN